MCDAASGDMTCPASQTGGGLLSSCFRSSNKIYNNFSQIQLNTPIDDGLEAHNLKIQILDLQAKELSLVILDEQAKSNLETKIQSLIKRINGLEINIPNSLIQTNNNIIDQLTVQLNSTIQELEYNKLNVQLKSKYHAEIKVKKELLRNYTVSTSNPNLLTDCMPFIIDHIDKNDIKQLLLVNTEITNMVLMVPGILSRTEMRMSTTEMYLLRELYNIIYNLHNYVKYNYYCLIFLYEMKDDVNNKYFFSIIITGNGYIQLSHKKRKKEIYDWDAISDVSFDIKIKTRQKCIDIMYKSQLNVVFSDQVTDREMKLSKDFKFYERNSISIY